MPVKNKVGKKKKFFNVSYQCELKRWVFLQWPQLLDLN